MSPPVDILAIGGYSHSHQSRTSWLDHLDRPELRRHLFYGGARSGKTDMILTWLCVQAATYPDHQL